MDESRKQFWNGGDTLSKKSFGKVALRDGEKIWSASRSAISIELPAKMISPAMTTPFLTRLIGVMEETLVFRNAQKPADSRSMS